MPNNIYARTSLIGGVAGSLDNIDGALLADLDIAIVVTLTGFYIYSLDDDSAASESSPDVISPDDNAGDLRWILVSKLLIADLDLNQKSIALDISPTADHTWNGEVFTGTAGENIAIFETVYLKSDGKYWGIDASAVGTAQGKIAIATAAITAEASGVFLQKGYIRDDSTTEWEGTLAAGDTMYLSETKFHLTDTVPTTASAVRRVVGFMESSTVLFFNPDGIWIVN